jgi:signal transduction histidine kinase
MSVLPLRRWLILALIVVLVVPILVTGTVAFHFLGSPQNDATSSAADLLRRDAANWHDPAWQSATAEKLSADDVAFVLLENGKEFYRSTADPLTVSSGGVHTVREVRVTDAGTSNAATAYVYARAYIGPPEAVRNWIAPSVGLTTLALTLAGVGWFFGRTVVAPLAATSEAARKIAAGDLDVALPTSRVREVAEVNTAFAAMSDALKTSLQHQASMEQERRLFIGAVVHDLRTPLFSLRGYLEGFAKGLADTPEKRARYVAVAQDKTAALERLVSDLFDFTRLEYLEQTPRQEPLDLADLLRRIVEASRPRSEAKELTVLVNVDSQPCPIDGDPHLLTRAVENLLDNAFRHTPNGGRIVVTCTAASDAVGFSVADSGPGIPPEDLPHLFTPLFRGETSRNRRTGGAGLGLTIARRILDAHGGDLIAANRAEGGAVFVATMPRGHGQRSAQRAESRRPSATVAGIETGTTIVAGGR